MRVKSCPLAVVRRQATLAELSRVVPLACGVVWNAIKAMKVVGAGRHVAVYLDDKINLEVGVELGTPFPGHGEVVASSTPAGTVATTTHIGPYQQLMHAHHAIHRWCEENSRTPVRPCWEVYAHGSDDPTKIRTDVFYLLKD
jgi:effector-binding domain-containing protein